MFPEELHSPISRRELLSRSALGLGSLAFMGWAQNALQARPQAGKPEAKGSISNKEPHFKPRAKRVIQFFLNGGPSHVDTFDYKPSLAKYAGKPLSVTQLTERKTGAAFPSPFKFKPYGESGILVSEIFQKTAAHIDDMAIIRSMYAQVPNHEPSLMLMNCGDSLQTRPSMGSWLLYGLGAETQNLPGFVAMCPRGLPIKDTSNWQAGFLPGAYQGTYIDSQHTQLSKLIENIEHPQVSQEDQRNQLRLIERWNRRHQQNRLDGRLESRIRSFELAFRMQQEAQDAFDIENEPRSIRELYGNGVHARQTLIARRLIERGVRYVQLWHGAGQPWDNHSNIEAEHRKLAAQIDQPLSALMTDLKQRGLFEDTLIIWGGEFGRTPTVELSGDGKPMSGRDHNHYGFTTWLAGGGIKGGTVYGATDEFGFAAVENRTSVHDLHATILHVLGLDHERLTYRYQGRDFRLTDVHGKILRSILT